MASIRRINKEVNDAEKALYAVIRTDDPYHLYVSFNGPDGTPYKEGIFTLSYSLPKDYPFKPPKVKFLTKIYHPNVSESGYICGCCCEILCDNWTPRYTIKEVVPAIEGVIAGYYADCQLNPASSDLYKNDQESFLKIAQEWTLKYAI